MLDRPVLTERSLILAPRGRDAVVAKEILRNARVNSDICIDLSELLMELQEGAEVAVVAEEAINAADARASPIGSRHSRPGPIFPSCC